MKKKLYLSLIIICGVLLLFKPLKAASRNEAYAINTNPGENADVEMRVSWHMDKELVNGKIIYTEVSDINWENAITLYPESYESTAFYGLRFRHYNAVLSNLTPNTKYMYKVGETTLSDPYYFKTSGSESFSFVWAGDWHTYMPIPTRLEGAMAIVEKAKTVEPNIDFFFSTGDIVAYGSDYEAWLTMFNQNPFKEYMWVNMIGNHDALNNVTGPNNDNYFQATHNYPKNGYASQEGKSYYFKYNNVLFFALNNENMNSLTPISVVQDWMASVIENNPTQYIFVSMHYQWFNGVSGNASQYNNWKSFFDEHQVDLALAGNNHVYVRTKRLFNDQVSPDKGTVYIQIPSSDNDRGQVMNDTFSNSDKIASRWTEGLNTIGAIIVTVTESSIRTRLIDRNGRVIDQANIYNQKPIVPVDKATFKESFKVYPSIISEDSVVVTSSVDAVGKIEKLEYYHADVLLGTNYYVKKQDMSYTISNAGDFDQLKVKIYYKDKTVEDVNLMVINQDFYKVNNLATIINNSLMYLKWDYHGVSSIEASIFINGVYFNDVDLSEQLVLLEDASITDDIEIRVNKDSLKGYYNSKYSIYGDVNLNGLIDEEDISLLQKHLLGIENVNIEALEFLDIDSDGDISLVDLTYLHLFINDYVESVDRKKEHTITYLDMFGQLISTETVMTGSSGTYPNVSVPEGYILSGWDTDIRLVKQDLIVQAMIERGETGE